jgi:ABC-type dipeptide/oligopeptide/nickel transport system ATPase subunit
MIARLRGVGKRYGKRPPVTALRNVTLTLAQGQRLLIAGESGSGKSTLARCLAGWEMPDEGTIEIFGGARPQLIPQEPATSLNPYWSALAIVAEPYRIRGMNKRSAAHRATEWLSRVELPPDCANRLSGQVSGGEQARLAIARALAALTLDGVQPGLLIFDESFSALDEALRVRLFDLLMKLRETLPVAYAFVSHDLAITARFVDSIAVMHHGELVEYGTAAQLFACPASPAMQRLVAGLKG